MVLICTRFFILWLKIYIFSELKKKQEKLLLPLLQTTIRIFHREISDQRRFLYEKYESEFEEGEGEAFLDPEQINEDLIYGNVIFPYGFNHKRLI